MIKTLETIGVIGPTIVALINVGNTYLKTRIPKGQYNREAAFSLVEFEWIYTSVVVLVAVIGVAFLGKESTWQQICVAELGYVFLILLIPYVIVVVYIVICKMSKEHQTFFQCLGNIISSISVYCVFSVLICYEAKTYISHQIEFGVLLYILFILSCQIFWNGYLETRNKVEYMVITSDGFYRSDQMPIKTDKFYCIRRRVTENYDEQLWIPEGNVEKMIAKIEHVNQSDIEKNGKKKKLN